MQDATTGPLHHHPQHVSTVRILICHHCLCLILVPMPMPMRRSAGEPTKQARSPKPAEARPSKGCLSAACPLSLSLVACNFLQIHVTYTTFAVTLTRRMDTHHPPTPAPSTSTHTHPPPTTHHKTTNYMPLPTAGLPGACQAPSVRFFCEAASAAFRCKAAAAAGPCAATIRFRWPAGSLSSSSLAAPNSTTAPWSITSTRS